MAMLKGHFFKNLILKAFFSEKMYLFLIKSLKSELNTFFPEINIFFLEKMYFFQILIELFSEINHLFLIFKITRKNAFFSEKIY